MKENRLYRIVNGKVIGGVAGGLAEFFGIDPTIIRIIFILLTIMGGGGLLIYIILWIVVPERYNVYNPYANPGRPAPPTGKDTGIGETYEGYSAGIPPVIKPDEVNPTVERGRKLDGGLIAGLVLILIGGFFLFERFFPQINFRDFWPLLLVLIGAVMIIRGFPVTKKSDEPDVIQDDITHNQKDNSTNNDLNL